MRGYSQAKTPIADFEVQLALLLLEHIHDGPALGVCSRGYMFFIPFVLHRASEKARVLWKDRKCNRGYQGSLQGREVEHTLSRLGSKLLYRLLESFQIRVQVDFPLELGLGLCRLVIPVFAYVDSRYWHTIR